VLGAAMVLPALLQVPLAHHVAAAEVPALSVAIGHPVFWAHPTAITGDVADAGACTAETCPTWSLAVASGAKQLRVGLDTPSREDGFLIQVLDPTGAIAGSATASNQFDDEAFVADPVAGTWTVRVLPKGATDAPFRIRAGLDEGLAASRPKGAELLPNLKAVPPMELGFIAPANPFNGLYPPDDVNPPLDVAGVHPVSCAPDESAPVAAGGQGAVKCLRLTTGPINVGEGPFDMRFDLITDTTQMETEPATLRGPMRQAVHLAGGGIVERAAGKYSFHTTHGHFHTEQILTYELYSVADPATGVLKKAGAGTKSGFCPADQLFGDFLAFQQAVPGAFGEGDTAAGGCSSPDGGSLGLTPGWGDVYRWQRPGQYVEFGDQPDGLYVIRATVDKSNLVKETDDSDNTSYALARVTGETIDLIERGQGSDPWDTNKTVFCGAGPATRDAFGPKITSGPVCAAAAGPAVPVVAPDTPAAVPTVGAGTLGADLPATGTDASLYLVSGGALAGVALVVLRRLRRRAR
jgi:LPXTG-motif cell wall-anchored protein